MKISFEQVLTQIEQKIERAIDVSLACLLLLTVFPVFLMIAVAIKLDSQGPILEGSSRYTGDGTRYKLYRFRTSATRVPLGADDTWTRVTLTRVGRFLRETGLEELPQLLNVIKGDTSLVNDSVNTA